MKPDYEMHAFTTAAAWRLWLNEHHATADGLWLRMYKKATGIPTVTYAEALDAALCYGWIDGIRKTYDGESFIQKFTPRRKASLWSKRNIEHVARLVETGLMMPAGLAEVERAQGDGRWAAAYDAGSAMVVPDDFLAELSGYPVAAAAYATLNKSGRYAIAWGLQTAKTEATRRRRLMKFIEQLEAR